MKPPPDYPSSPDPFLVDGRLTLAAQRNTVVAIAVKYLGVRYTWGGATPKTGFDCSGLVQYVFARLGISLPHFAAAQYYSPVAVWIPPNRLQPGDLVFFAGDGTRKAPGHVGIYVGDGYLIDAPHTGAYVRVDSLNERWFANNYVAAKRIAGDLPDADGLGAMGEREGAVLAVRRSLPRITGPAFGVLPPTAMDPTATHTPVSQDDRRWAAAGLGGALLFLVGAVPYRRRRRRRSRLGGSSGCSR